MRAVERQWEHKAKAVEAQSKGSVLATKAVEAQGKAATTFESRNSPSTELQAEQNAESSCEGERTALSRRAATTTS